jgi:hypothetical protein
MTQLVVLGLLGCGWVAERADQALDLDLDLDQAQIEHMCRAAKRIDADTRADAGKKLDRLAGSLAQDHLGKAGVALLEALKRTPPAARRRVVDEVLQRNGIEDLDCPPLERILFR